MENLELIFISLHKYVATLFKNTEFEEVLDINKQILVAGSPGHEDLITLEENSPGNVKLPILTLIPGLSISQDFELGEEDGIVFTNIKILIQAETLVQEQYLSEFLRRGLNRKNIDITDETSAAVSKPVIASMETGLVTIDKILGYGEVAKSQKFQSILEIPITYTGSKFIN